MKIELTADLCKVAEYVGQDADKFAHGFLAYLADKDAFGDCQIYYDFSNYKTLGYWLHMAETDDMLGRYFEEYTGKPLTSEINVVLRRARVSGYRCPECGNINAGYTYINYRSWSTDGYDFEENWDGIKIVCPDCGKEYKLD